MTSEERATKKAPDRRQKALRLLLSAIDPRAWLHLLKMVNYYNYSHVAPLRRMKVGVSPNISPDAVFSNAERITVGDRARIGSRCHLWAGPSRGRIIIGDDALLGPEVLITAASYDYNAGSPITLQPMNEADVVIGNDVWLATRVVVLPGSRIGDGAIIAAGAIVKGEIPPMTIAAGSPAKVVSKRSVADT